MMDERCESPLEVEILSSPVDAFTNPRVQRPVIWSPKLPSQIEPVKEDKVIERWGEIEDEEDDQESSSGTEPSSPEPEPVVRKTKTSVKATPVNHLQIRRQQLEKEIEQEREREKDRDREKEAETCDGKSPNKTRQRIAHRPSIPVNDKRRPRAPLGPAKKVARAHRVKFLDVIINEYLQNGFPEEEAYKLALNEEQSIASRAANKSIYANLVASLKKRIREKSQVPKR